MNKTYISESIKYIGVDDRETDLFEGQYIIPNGVSYNSYVIFDEKIAVVDTVDKIAADKWVENLEKALNGKAPDYLVISHMEPDHASNVKLFAEKYPHAKLVGNAKTFAYMPQFFNLNVDDRKVVVKEGDTLELGQHTLTFIMAPMVHWPEVMVAYDSKDKVLFSADGFGKFGALDADEDWACEARRYYFNIVGKYGAQVQALLKKAAKLDIQTICPLHGPILNENLGYYIDKYDIWSSYRPEDKGIMIAYGSMHGNTKQAALELKTLLEEKGAQKVAVADLTRDDMAEAIEDAFRYDRLVVACPTYDGTLFPAVEDFLYHLKIKNYQSRKVALIENGTWAPMAGKKMKEYFEGMKNITLCDTVVTVKSTLNETSAEQLKALADELSDN
ncbi:FprA family A-type flavoprotein [Oscillospiraceae bacterium LCP25S3_E3]|nr:FprA family A-type flavoprotein [Oscillospiraceae bacterium]